MHELDLLSFIDLCNKVKKYTYTKDRIASIFKTNEDYVIKAIKSLKQKGYLEPTKHIYKNGKQIRYEMTKKGYSALDRDYRKWVAEHGKN